MRSSLRMRSLGMKDANEYGNPERESNKRGETNRGFARDFLRHAVLENCRMTWQRRAISLVSVFPPLVIFLFHFFSAWHRIEGEVHPGSEPEAMPDECVLCFCQCGIQADGLCPFFGRLFQFHQILPQPPRIDGGDEKEHHVLTLILWPEFFNFVFLGLPSARGVIKVR